MSAAVSHSSLMMKGLARTGLLFWVLFASFGLGQADYLQEQVLSLPQLSALQLEGRRLRVIATTSIIGDVVANIGGEAIQLTTLMRAGQDPHSYEPKARDLVTVTEADVIFVNGWKLEEGLLEDLSRIASNIALVPVSANTVPIIFGGQAHQHDDDLPQRDQGHDLNGPGLSADPHTWLSLDNVKQWVTNIAQILSDLDPANAEVFSANAASYLNQLDTLASYAAAQFARLPAEQRFVVSNHDSLAYLARDYGLEVIATVIPASSTLAEPSARELAALIEEMRLHRVCAVFSEHSSDQRLAQTVAAELDYCELVKVVPLYSGALGPDGSQAETFLLMFRSNVEAIVEGLSQGHVKQ